MPSKPHLLFLSHRLPWPPHNGAAIRTYNILKLLADRFDVTMLCFDRRDPALVRYTQRDRAEALRPLGHVEVLPIPQEESRARLVWDHLRSLATGRAYVYYVHDSRQYRQALRRSLASRPPDIVHMDSLDLVRLLPELDGLPVVVTHHNVESSLMARRAGAESGLRAAYLRHQAGLLRRMEQKWLDRVALNVAVSPEDQAEFESISPRARCATIPNGVDTEAFYPSDELGTGCVFVGGTSWFPNRDALEWFSAEILPRLLASPESPGTRWVGRAKEEERERFSRPGLELTGYVDDIRPWVYGAAVFIAPLRVGGGTRLKILDAWAMGKAVVSTRIGCEGLETHDGGNILLADDADSFTAAVLTLLRDEALRTRLGSAARETAERRYSWQAIGSIIDELYLPLAAGQPPPGRAG